MQSTHESERCSSPSEKLVYIQINLRPLQQEGLLYTVASVQGTFLIHLKNTNSRNLNNSLFLCSFLNIFSKHVKCFLVFLGALLLAVYNYCT